MKVREPSARYLAALQPPLVEHFELVASAPDGMARLREVILTLAVQGKLVKQDPADAPATTLIGEIRQERERLASTGKIAPQQATALPADVDGLPDLPRGWARVRFGDYVHELCTGPFGSLIHKGDYVDDGIPLINPSHMVRGRIQPDQTVTVSETMAAQLGAYRLSAGDVLLARRGEVGRYALVTAREAGWLCGTGSFFVRLAASVDRGYFGLMLEDPRLRAQLQTESVGATMTNLNQRILMQVPLAIPPIAEQARIVARVKELMHLCDALEAKGRLESTQHGQLMNTLLGTLTDSASPEELATNWQRVAAHFDLLLDRPEAVNALEKAVLELALRGLLVPQDANDEPAAVLLERMTADRDRLVGAGKARRGDPLAAGGRVETAFALPQGWEWARFDQLVDPNKPISYGVLVPGPEVADGVPFVRIADLSIASPPEKPEKKISTAVDSQYQRTRLEGGEILMGVVGSIGKLGVAPQSWAGANIARAICRIVPAAPIDREFMLLLLESEFMQRSFAGDTRTLAQPTLNVGLIRTSPTPVPPLAEQQRIVARVNQLRHLCAELRKRLVAQQTTQTQLAEALVESGTAA